MNAPASRPRPQRQMVVLVVLISALVVIVGFQVLPLFGGSAPAPQPAPVAAKPAPAAPAASASRRPGTPARGPGGRAARATAQGPNARNGGGVMSGVEEVHLAKLQQPEPEPIDGHRNPFGFGADPKTASAGSGPGLGGGPNITPMQPPPALPVATGPPPVPPPPPITLKFFGVVTAPGRIGKVAALGDGKFVYHGREGEIVEGRYRIVKIGEESIQMEYVDGRGRQTIRLSGK